MENTKKIIKSFIINPLVEYYNNEEKRQNTLRKMKIYGLHASEVDILEEAGEL